MIFLTELSDLSEGLWWARKITGEGDLGREPWRIVEIYGSAPFLTMYELLAKYEVDRSGRMGWGVCHTRLDPINANEWEFGPRIDVPSDKDRVEYAPKAERMMA